MPLSLSEVVDRDVTSQTSDSSSNPVGHGVEPEPDREQNESATTVGAFSGFFSGIATAVEEKVSWSEVALELTVHSLCV